MPQQVAVGDQGVAASGIRWWHPTMLDLQLLIILSHISQGAGGLVGLAAPLPFSVQPRAWIAAPAPASVFFSPVDAVWNAFLDP